LFESLSLRRRVVASLRETGFAGTFILVIVPYNFRIDYKKALGLTSVIPEVVIGNPASKNFKSGSPTETFGDDNLLSGELEQIWGNFTTQRPFLNKLLTRIFNFEVS
jgi:hypothetical protein